MLLALLIGGAVAAVAAPIAMGVFDGDDAEDDMVEAEEDASDNGSLLDEPGTDYVVDGTVPANDIEGFEPGKDTATLQLADWDANLEVRNAEDGSVQMDYMGTEGPVSVTFAGLSELPAADINILITDPETGEDTVVCLLDCLTDPSMLTPAETEEDVAELESLDPLEPELPVPDVSPEDALQPLSPIDPDTPDVPGVDLPDVSPLGPVDPDVPDVPGVDLPDVAPIGPVDPDAVEDLVGGLVDVPGALVSDVQDGHLPDATPTGGVEDHVDDLVDELAPLAPTLDPDPFPEPLAPLVEPTLPGFGQTQLVLRGPDEVLIAAQIDNFDASEDILQISLDMDPNGPPPDISVTPKPDGSAAEVFLNGAPMAVLHGAPDAGLHNIRVVPFADQGSQGSGAIA